MVLVWQWLHDTGMVDGFEFRPETFKQSDGVYLSTRMNDLN
jgi:hypothetical protein